MSVYRALESGKVKTTKAQSHAISAAANLNLQDVLMFFLTDESGVRRDIAGRFLVCTVPLPFCPGTCVHSVQSTKNILRFLIVSSRPILIFMQHLVLKYVPFWLQLARH